ncbi:MAG: hypothetical protein JO202_02035 [Ktedonobacteraceae bacterium]|nr:hypothetical protein [Ktedonobacteraceae bacterium]
MNILTRLNPFKGRQPGNAQGRAIEPPFPQYHWEESISTLQRNPSISNEDFAVVMGMNTYGGFTADESPIVESYRAAATREVRRRQLTAPPTKQPSTTKRPNPTTGPLPDATGLQQVQSGNVRLLTYSPEELLQQVERRRSTVSFDVSGTATFMDNFNQAWSWAGPLLFALGTIGEIFLVLWERQKVQSWFTGFTIVAVSLIAEGTLLAISFTAKRLRNRADQRSSGWTDKEKRKLETLQQFWSALALGVAATQVAFVVAQTNSGDIGVTGVWIIALVRSLAALVADAYTAFVSEEKPTSGALAIEQQDKETEFTKKLLDQKALEVETLNAGAIKVQEVGIEAEMRQDRMTTQKEIAHMQNQAQIETMKTEQEQKTLLDRMRNSAMRAVFDPEMDPEEREQIIALLSGLAGATKKLPRPSSTTVTEEDE